MNWRKWTIRIVVAIGIPGLGVVLWLVWWFFHPFAHITLENTTGDPVYIETLTYDGKVLMEDSFLRGIDRFLYVHSSPVAEIKIAYRRGRPSFSQVEKFYVDQGGLADCYYAIRIQTKKIEVSDCGK